MGVWSEAIGSGDRVGAVNARERRLGWQDTVSRFGKTGFNVQLLVSRYMDRGIWLCSDTGSAADKQRRAEG